MAPPAGRASRGGVQHGGARTARSADRCEGATCQDWAAGAGAGFFGQRARTKPRSERKAMIDRRHRLSVTRQARLLALSRASVYYRPRPVSHADLALMRRIDELHLELPFTGSRLLRDLLNA